MRALVRIPAATLQRRSAFAVICSALALNLCVGASAQSGSTGGTIGNVNKQAHGSDDRARPRHVSPSTAAPRPASKCKLASVWANEVANLGSSVWTISADGAAVERGLGAAQGRASLAGGTLTIRWRTCCSGGTYVVRVNASCSAGTGKVTVLDGLGAGTVNPVTFTAIPSGNN
ncbi:MAG TPA: hypothetical protein VFB45_14830 [Pseudolabrys sp.]|nr:hypothetical protein [Pseudolabrys sp.]